ncbi:hypothetical protein ASPCADRAFT_11004 [Aspergillus carbonarius ITEM 5010]|uniref:Major facilitator superfamily (MFS) profile domain-containing protein n=1 Tax=Aspergillus carbonarius (strain ITEM 5010) TaxID=602072 RepID=A0A1R3R6H5_ASPC5|nr:hypothetical protein ASPCADRAFT_11004 [Aspergillus carbonarius ITEM 5010]
MSMENISSVSAGGADKAAATAVDDLKPTQDLAHVERVLSPADKLQGGDARVDTEVLEYAARGQIEVDAEDSRRLRRMIDRRVLVIMIVTYFLQALDKGTMSFASIMGIKTDANLQGQEVGACSS